MDHRTKLLKTENERLRTAIQDAIADLNPLPREDCGCEHGKCSQCCDCHGCDSARAKDVQQNLEQAIK